VKTENDGKIKDMKDITDGREKLKARTGKLELAIEPEEKSSVIIDRIKRPKGFGDQDERMRIKR
jgi:hypothetical protein